MAIFVQLGFIVLLDLMKKYLAQLAHIIEIRVNQVSQIAFHAKVVIIMISKVSQAAENVVLQQQLWKQDQQFALALEKIESTYNQLEVVFVKMDLSLKLIPTMVIKIQQMIVKL